MACSSLIRIWKLRRIMTRLRHIEQFLGQRGREGDVGRGKGDEKEEVGGERRRKRGKSKLVGKLR